KVTRSDPADVIAVEGAHPALIDPETFEAVQRKLAARRSGPVGPRRPDVYPLSGLLFCSGCGAPMYGVTVVKSGTARTGRRLPWKKHPCSRSLRRGKGACRHNAVLEADVLGRMAEVLTDHFAGDEALARVRARLEERRRLRAGEAARGTSRLRRRLQTLA